MSIFNNDIYHLFLYLNYQPSAFILVFGTWKKDFDSLACQTILNIFPYFWVKPWKLDSMNWIYYDAKQFAAFLRHVERERQRDFRTILNPNPELLWKCIKIIFLKGFSSLKHKRKSEAMSFSKIWKDFIPFYYLWFACTYKVSLILRLSMNHKEE